MRSLDDLIKNYSKSNRVNQDFEKQVFTEIERRKKLRKITVFGVFALALVFLVFSVFLFFPRAGEKVKLGNRFSSHINRNPDQIEVKEEIPVLEDVFFTLYDRETNYAIEQVSNSEEEGI